MNPEKRLLAGMIAVSEVPATLWIERTITTHSVQQPSITTLCSASVATASTLREMNPLVSVSAADEASLGGWQGTPPQADFVICIDRGIPEIQAAEAVCRNEGILFFAAGAKSIFGWAFADLGPKFEYVLEQKVDGSDETQRTNEAAEFCTWGEAMAADLTGRRITRIHPVYLMLRGTLRGCILACCESQHGVMYVYLSSMYGFNLLRSDTALTLGGADSPTAALDKDLGQPCKLDAALLESFTAESAAGMPAVAAVTGGVLANYVLRAVSGKGEPLDNMFLFSIANGAGEVSRFVKTK